VRQQCVAGGGQPDAALVPVEQRLAELALEPADLRAHRRLSDRQAERRARDLALLGHRDEVGEVPQLHKQSL
jgi:hypothetical protein